MQRCQEATSFAAPAGGLLSSAGRHGLFILGGISFAVGAVGLVLPLLPTTIFWIIAAWAWSKSCPRLQQRLYAVPGAGPHVRHGSRKAASAGAASSSRWAAWPSGSPPVRGRFMPRR